MARRDSGKWVARAAATGGGRSYRGQMPVKWYGSLFLIVLLGIVFVVYSRYERPEPGGRHAAGDRHPLVCGAWPSTSVARSNRTCPPIPTRRRIRASIPTVTASSGSSRPRASDAGNNATLSRFVSEYPKLRAHPEIAHHPGREGPHQR